MRATHRWRWWAAVLPIALAASLTAAQAPTAPSQPPVAPAAAAAPAPAATPPAPPSPVSSMRNKISAGDLPSAESILEVHREKYGEDGPWLVGLGWLARGAFLVGDTAAARRYAAQARGAVTKRLGGKSLDKDRDAESALGAAIEVEAQLVERRRSRAEAAKWLQAEMARQQGSTAFQSRLHKRLNLLTLVGQPAPELVVEDFLIQLPPDSTGGLSTDHLLLADWSNAHDSMIRGARGRPLVLFLWAEWCGDCRAQIPALARVLERHRGEGLLARAITRWYDPPESLATEKARALRAWYESYEGMKDTPRIVSTASMVRYGGSATPTFVFIDRQGIVRRYAPTRLTEAELERAVAQILR